MIVRLPLTRAEPGHPVARWITRIVGLLVAIDAALTLGLGAALWFLAFLVIPVVIAEMLVGVKIVAGKDHWDGLVPVVVVVDYGLGLLLITGILAPLAIASLAVTSLLLATWLVGLLVPFVGRRPLA